jgi:hypothetical protein
MRGQIDKLQSDRMHIEHYIEVLNQVNQAVDTENKQIDGFNAEQSSMAKTVEMIIQAQEAERGNS